MIILSRELGEIAPGLMAIALAFGTYGFALIYTKRRRARRR